MFGIFPLYTANYHDAESRQSAVDRVISSYTPTIKSVAHARHNDAKSVRTGDQKILLDGMPTTPSQDDLLPVEQEMDELVKIFPSTMFKQNPERSEMLPILAKPRTSICRFSVCRLLRIPCSAASS